MTDAEVFNVTPVLSTNAYSDGDLLFPTTEIAGFFKPNSHYAKITGVQILDLDDQGVKMDLVFFDTSVDSGTANDAFAIDDTDALSMLGYVSASADDFLDWGGHRTACIKCTDGGDKLPGWIKSASGGTSLYVCGITRGGTPTYSASGVRLKISVEYPGP